MSAFVLDLLAKLQEVANKIDTLDARRKEAAEEKEKIDAALAKARGNLEDKLKEQHAADMERRKHELKLKEEKERQARMKGRAGEVKTGREYQAVLAETNALKLSVQAIEESLLKDVETVESFQKEVDEIKARIGRIEEQSVGANRIYDEAVAHTESDILAHKAEEKAMLKELPREIMDLYTMIRKRRGGHAVVEARNEACTACFMRLPPQSYIEIVKKAAVVRCPNCHRILIPPQDKEVSPEA